MTVYDRKKRSKRNRVNRLVKGARGKGWGGLLERENGKDDRLIRGATEKGENR